MNDKCFNAGVYIRLSREDGNKFEESYSIKNQREQIKQYIKNQNDITIYNYYSDDGKTGTNFDRPGFQRMMKDMYSGNINCIIVKDLSRFGRNYIEVGRYIEYIFPSNNIRFISINDGIDSFKDPESINNVIVPFKNLMNDEYCRDISRKIKKVKEIQRLNGEVTNGSPPYGYKIKNKKYVIDKKVKDIIKNIFDLCIAGESSTQIAFKLNEEKIDCPMVYLAKEKGKKLNKEYYWSSAKIGDILKNRVYCGDLVQGKTTTLSNKVKVSIAVPKDKWIITENAHDAIIDRDTFNKAQESIKKRTTASGIRKNYFPSVFKGYLKCYYCHKTMVKKTCLNYKNKNYIAFGCYTYLRVSHNLCTNHNIGYLELSNNFLEKIKKDIKNLIYFEEKILNNISNKEELENINKKINDIQNQQTETLKLKKEVLLDLKKNLITKEDYEFYTNNYDSTLKEINNKLNDLKDREFEITQEARTMQEFIRTIKKYQNIEEIKPDMLKEIIKTIYVKDDKSVIIEYIDNDVFENIKERCNKWVE